jgi:thiol-disulfide isomerase/thioredoxin
MALTGGLSDAAEARVPAESDAPVGLISEGEDVDLGAYARPDGRTVFLFTKSWCGGCWRLAPRVEEAVAAAPDLSLRVIDIDSWESEVARHYDVTVAPYLVLYEDGVQAAAGVDDVLARIER